MLLPVAGYDLLGARRVVAAALLVASCRMVAAQLPMVRDPGQGVVALPSGGTGAAELSGIAWTGGTNYLAVGDNGAPAIWTMSVALDASTGRITSATVTGSIAAALGGDSEGIAYRSTTNSVFVSDEVASSITQFGASSGATIGGVSVPAIYASANVQSNMGLEALAYGPGGLWTANEEALVPDGPLSTTSEGSWVRIQRFDAALAAAGQWAYRTDPISALSPFTTAERSGVVDILPWTASTLLVLEREFGGSVIPDFRSRLFGVDVTVASDVSALASLTGGGFTPLVKTLLWEGDFGTSNFEGMAFGPSLVDGWTSLLLVSDNGGGIAQNMYALAVVPEPSTWAMGAAGTACAALGVRRRKGDAALFLRKRAASPFSVHDISGVTPRVGFEPTTYRLTAGRSTVELSGIETFTLAYLGAEIEPLSAHPALAVSPAARCCPGRCIRSAS